MLPVLLLLASAVHPCPVEAAQYRLRDGSTVTARFYHVPSTQDWPTGLALRIHVGKSGRSYWFLPWQGGTDDKVNLAWVREKHTSFEGQPIREDMEYFQTDLDYRFIHSVPHAGGPAPARLFLPDLRKISWYRTAVDRRDGIPKAFFDLTSCSAPADGVRPEIEFPPVP